jgi:hypothetical protein
MFIKVKAYNEHEEEHKVVVTKYGNNYYLIADQGAVMQAFDILAGDLTIVEEL